MPSPHGGGILLCMGGAPGDGWFLSQDSRPALRASRSSNSGPIWRTGRRPMGHGGAEGSPVPHMRTSPDGHRARGLERVACAAGPTAKRNPALLFSVEKTKWATAIASKNKMPYMETYAQMDDACTMRESLSYTPIWRLYTRSGSACCANKEKRNCTDRPCALKRNPATRRYL